MRGKLRARRLAWCRGSAAANLYAPALLAAASREQNTAVTRGGRGINAAARDGQHMPLVEPSLGCCCLLILFPHLCKPRLRWALRRQGTQRIKEREGTARKRQASSSRIQTEEESCKQQAGRGEPPSHQADGIRRAEPLRSGCAAQLPLKEQITRRSLVRKRAHHAGEHQ